MAKLTGEIAQQMLNGVAGIGPGPGDVKQVWGALCFGPGRGPNAHVAHVMHKGSASGLGCCCPAGLWLLLPQQRSERAARARAA